MTNSIDVFQILRRIPNISEEEARILANEITRDRDVVTKADLMEFRLGLEAKIDEFKKELRHTIWTVAGFLLIAQSAMTAAAFSI